MNEQLITFETAKLAKEKGFIPESKIYSKLVDEKNEYYWNNPQFGKTPSDYSKEYYITSTQSLLQKWLREKHGIHVTPVYDISGYYVRIDSYNIKKQEVKCLFHSEDKGLIFDTYEQALEKGLIETLKLIKSN